MRSFYISTYRNVWNDRCRNVFIIIYRRLTSTDEPIAHIIVGTLGKEVLLLIRRLFLVRHRGASSVDKNGAAKRFHCLLGGIGQFVAIQLGCPGIVLLLGVGRVAVVLPEELRGICVASQLHLANLCPGPVRVQVGGAHEGQMNAQTAMDRRAVDADEYTVRHGGPGWVLGIAVKAGLQDK